MCEDFCNGVFFNLNWWVVSLTILALLLGAYAAIHIKSDIKRFFTHKLQLKWVVKPKQTAKSSELSTKVGARGKAKASGDEKCCSQWLFGITFILIMILVCVTSGLAGYVYGLTN